MLEHAGHAAKSALIVTVGVGLLAVGLAFGWSLGLWVVALLPLGVGALFSALGGWLLMSAWRYAKLVRRLLVVGIVTTGTIIDNDARELRTGGSLLRKLRYEYTDNQGVRHAGLTDWTPRAEALHLKPQTTGEVRYDPAQPGKSAWFGANR